MTTKTRRNNRIRKLYSTGLSGKEVGDIVGLTRERIRQLLGPVLTGKRRQEKTLIRGEKDLLRQLHTFQFNLLKYATTLVHGNAYVYTSLGCRCEKCCKENTRRAQIYWAKKKELPITKHGVYSSYSLGCRCIKCKESARKYNASPGAVAGQKRYRFQKSIPAEKHGKTYTYNLGCRCKKCRKAKALGNRKYNGTPQNVLYRTKAANKGGQ